MVDTAAREAHIRNLSLRDAANGLLIERTRDLQALGETQRLRDGCKQFLFITDADGCAHPFAIREIMRDKGHYFASAATNRA